MGWDLVAVLIQNIEDCQPHVRVMASIRLAVGDSVCRTDYAEHQSQSKRYEKRREDGSHSQGKFFHLIGSPIFDRLILNFLPLPLLVVNIRLGSGRDRKSTRLHSSHVEMSYAVFC